MKVKSEIIIVVAFMTLIFVLFLIPVRHTNVNTFTVTTKDAVKVTMTVETVYRESLIIMPIKKDGIEHSTQNLALRNASTLAQSYTSLELYKLKQNGIESLVYKSIANETQIIDVDNILFEQAFVDYMNKNKWFGDIIMIKTN